MKHDDTTLQAAIDAAMMEIGRQIAGNNFAASLDYEASWPAEQSDRLALAKAFLAKLPAGLQASEADKALADLASRLANIAYDPVQPMAFAKAVADHVDDLREDINHAQKVSLTDARATDATIARLKAELDALRQPILADDGRSLGQVAKEAFIGAPGLTDDWMNAAAQAVANVVLAQAIRRLEKVTVMEVEGILREAWMERGGWFRSAAEAVRARLIAAVRGEEQDEPDNTDWKAKYEQAEAELKKLQFDKHMYSRVAEALGIEKDVIGHVMALKQELAALKSSQLGILRPLSEMPETVPDGCVRMFGAYYRREDRWPLTTWKEANDTHFADIRLPVTDTPATEASDPYARLKAYVKAGARIRLDGEYVRTDWTLDKEFPFRLPPEKYEVHPDDLHLVPEYAPVNEQPKQQVPLGPEEKLQAIKDIIDGKTLSC